MFSIEQLNLKVQIEISYFCKLQSIIRGKKVAIEDAAREWIDRYYDLWLKTNHH